MFEFSVGDRAYKVQFSYRCLAKTDILDRIQKMAANDENSNRIQYMLETVAELLLAGMQKE